MEAGKAQVTGEKAGMPRPTSRRKGNEAEKVMVRYPEWVSRGLLPFPIKARTTGQVKRGRGRGGETIGEFVMRGDGEGV